MKGAAKMSLCRFFRKHAPVTAVVNETRDPARRQILNGTPLIIIAKLTMPKGFADYLDYL
jgi:hypothetical protein